VNLRKGATTAGGPARTWNNEHMMNYKAKFLIKNIVVELRKGIDE